MTVTYGIWCISFWMFSFKNCKVFFARLQVALLKQVNTE
ncbi:hypothetical protein B4098_1396 [Heyndrickxia coagulans]|uniref:Uncharacterized protein n=1 Tax=Heyndrickxia coagulans TaxID=1398 RepID=A0A150JXU4_HEYCO|nr:hypothetical protein B4098_1396 [Heyndrickxia coagulans]KYC62486.1 hypothetical protein B4100_1537 [Heyndrickxia coagulans]KYC68005.1 hypothetical protein B4099_1590 [Heyndrickxia coagulans]